MTVSVLRYDRPFSNIEDHVTRLCRDDPRAFEVCLGSRRCFLDAQQMLDALYAQPRDASLGIAVWRYALVRAQNALNGDDRLLAVWLALPDLRWSVRKAVRWRKDRREVESEALLALLEAQQDVDVGDPLAGPLYLAAARSRLFRALRLTAARERPTADIAAIAAARNRVSPFDNEDRDETNWEVHVRPRDRADGLSAVLRFTVSPRRLEGARIGALAHRLGLREVVYRARRPSEGEPVGSLSLVRTGSER